MCKVKEFVPGGSSQSPHPIFSPTSSLRLPRKEPWSTRVVHSNCSEQMTFMNASDEWGRHSTPLTLVGRPYSVAVGDFNGDGALDLAAANNLSDNVSVLINETRC